MSWRKHRFYTDEHVQTAVISGLRLRGVDVVITKEVDMLGASDMDHLRLAASQDRVIFTQDADFLRLHAKGTPHSGIVYAHRQMPVGDVVRGLMLIYQVLDADDMRNHIEFL